MVFSFLALFFSVLLRTVIACMTTTFKKNIDKDTFLKKKEVQDNGSGFIAVLLTEENQCALMMIKSISR